MAVTGDDTTATELRLPRQDEHEHRYAALRTVLRDFSLAYDDDPLGDVLWSLAAAFKSVRDRPWSATSRSPGSAAARRLARDLAWRRRWLPVFFSAGDALLVIEVENHAWVLEPIGNRLSARRDRLEAQVPWRTLRRATRRAARLADDLLAACRERGVGVPLGPPLLHALAREAAHAYVRVESLLASQRPSVVAVASTHGRPSRAAVRAARTAGVPSVYFPHAPMIADAAIVDLPVDRAGLRGPAEARHYAGFGVEEKRLDVVGNPSLTVEAMPALDPQRPAVFAAGNYGPARLDPMLRLLEAAGPEELIVSPHPLADPDRLRRRCADHWVVWEGRTYDLLRSGTPLVVQHSSGSALEALYLGVPTIELAFPGNAEAYPAIRPPYAHVAGSASELQRAVVAARAQTGEADRSLIRDWARSWNGTWAGDEAAERGAALLRCAAVDGATGPLWDGRPEDRGAPLVG